MKDLLMHFAEWMSIGAHEKIGEGNVDAYLEGAKFEAKPLEWINTSISATAVTALGLAEVYGGIGERPWRLDVKRNKPMFFETSQQAKDEMQKLHNEQVLAWLG